MNITDSTLKIPAPNLQPDEMKGLQDFWEVYESHRPEITVQLLHMASEHPEFKFILQNTPTQRSTEQEQASLELQRRAIYDGEWEPYLKNLQLQGMHYAQAGLSFHAWFEIVASFRRYTVPYLLEAYGESAKRLLSAMNGVDILIEITLSVIGESYLETKEQLIRKQEKAIGEAAVLKEAETKIRKLNVDLQERAVQLETTVKELEAFSYSVSHDLRAPLRSIDGFSQALLEDYAEQLPAEGQNYLMRVRAAAQRMAQLIDDLLGLARVSRTPLQPRFVNLSALAQTIAQDLKQTQPERQATFLIAPDLAVSGDQQLLQIMLENLMGNAWKFTSKQTDVFIEVGAQDQDNAEKRCYFVRDNGAGFDMTFADKLFGAFQRFHTVEQFPGTGIGLATVQRIIRRHGGEIWAESSVNNGTTFYFTLPRKNKE